MKKTAFVFTMMAVFGLAAAAPVLVEEYGDYECPYCAHWFKETYPVLKERYFDIGFAEFSFKNFPLQFHEHAQKAAEAAECARDQGRFMEYHAKLYNNQQALTVADLKAYANDVGLNTAVFDSCLDRRSKASLVRLQAAEAASRDVRGTPAFFIGGQKISGSQPDIVFINAIEKALGNQTYPTPTPVSTPAPTPTPYVTPIPTPFPVEQFTLRFSNGWNLFSVPLGKARVIRTDCRNGKIYGYDERLGSYSAYSTMETGSYLANREGFWFKATGACLAIVEGTGRTSLEGTALYAGWNLVGGSYPAEGAGALLSGCAVERGPLAYDTVQRQWVKAGQFEPGRGFFVKTARQCTMGADDSAPPFPN
ncbi:MAG: thioredoxin domain-containing protein [Candidatus Micrarchaeota archaeon]